MTDNSNNVRKGNNSTLENTPHASDTGNNLNSINDFFSSEIPITEDGETWLSICKGLNILAASAGGIIARDGFYFSDPDAYGAALEFIRELNEKMLKLIKPY